jgi:glutamate-1-semialdehyde 2,1-aminomutase
MSPPRPVGIGESAVHSGFLRSAAAYERACRVFPDGVSRVTIERDSIPRYMVRGEGAYLFDLDGRRFLDLNANFTTLIHGHAFAPVQSAIEQQLRLGLCFANPTETEIELAELLCSRIPHLERIRFVTTGSEAVMFAIKAARAFTGRSAIAKIEGAYHGAYDWAEVAYASHSENWGSGTQPVSTPNYRGMPGSVLSEVVALRFNDVEGVERRIGEHADRLAAILIDPMPSRAGLIPPEPAFIRALTATARRHGILIVCDEVLNLRQGLRGAAARYELAPDLFALGKIIGGGLPVGAVGGRAEVMQVFAAGNARAAVPQGGTFAANPLAMAAGLAAMRALDERQFAHLEALGDALRAGLRRVIADQGAPLSISGAGSLFRIHLTRTPPREFRDLPATPTAARILRELSRHFAAHGILLPSGAAACLATPMQSVEIDLIVEVFADFVRRRGDLLEELS